MKNAAGLVLTGGVCCGLQCLAWCMRRENQDEGKIAAWSRWRRTIVVVRQFSFVATSLNHPPAGIRCGVGRAALRMSPHTGPIVRPVFVSVVWLLSVVMACSPGPSLAKQSGRIDICTRGSVLPGFAVPCCQKERSAGESVPGILSCGQGPFTRGRVYGSPAYFCGTNTLIRRSFRAADIMVKCAGYGDSTPRFNR